MAERYATEIDDELAGKPLDRALLDAFADSLAGGAVADVGCGPGHVAAHLSEIGANVLGFDLSPAMCAITTRDANVPAAAANMTALPVRSASLAGLISWYAVIHLDAEQRAAAYAEFARVLRPGGYALMGFHVSDPDIPAGGARRLTEWWDRPVELTFRFLDPDDESRALAAAGLRPLARLDREPYAEVEHASRRCYLLTAKR